MPSQHENMQEPWSKVCTHSPTKGKLSLKGT